jgi:hypothetical protein
MTILTEAYAVTLYAMIIVHERNQAMMPNGIIRWAHLYEGSVQNITWHYPEELKILYVDDPGVRNAALVMIIVDPNASWIHGEQPLFLHEHQLYQVTPFLITPGAYAGGDMSWSRYFFMALVLGWLLTESIVLMSLEPKKAFDKNKTQ